MVVEGDTDVRVRAETCGKHVFSVGAVKPKGARRSRRFRVAQTRSRLGNPEAQEVADVEAA